MLREDVAEELRERQLEDGFLLPSYDDYCFANIPETILALFDAERGREQLPDDVFDGVDAASYDSVVLFLFDGFGFEHWQRYREEMELFDRWTEQGRVTPLTTIFPSTTSAALTTIHTGLTPQEHGLAEWTLYLEEFGTVGQTLPFTDLDGTPLPLEPGPDVLFDGEPVYGDLADENVETVVFVKQETAGSEYSQLVFKDAEIVPYMNLADLAVTLRQRLEEDDGDTYYHVYVDYIDAAAHHNGPDGVEHRAQIRAVSRTFMQDFVEPIDVEEAGETLLLATADHGHIPIDPAETVDLYGIDGFRDLLGEDPTGETIPPTGSPRDVLLHAGEDRTATLLDRMEDELPGAKVVTTEEAVDDGLFGTGEPSERFLDRIGDVLVVPDDGGTVWFREGDETFELRGHHGGLDPREMLVPFAVASLRDLADR